MIFNIVINHLFEKVWYYKEFLMSSFLGRKEFTVLLYNDSNLLGKSDISVAVQLFPIWSWVESDDQIQRDQWFFSAFFLCQEPVGFASLFPWKAFSLSLILCSVALLQFIYAWAKLSRFTPWKDYFLHIPVFWECPGSDWWCFGSILDHWHFDDAKFTR